MRTLMSYAGAAAAIFRGTGDRQDEGTALKDLGNARRAMDRFGDAAAAHQEAAATFRETGEG